MADSTGGAGAAPVKKSFFKKADWQKKPAKVEDGKTDIFSHSSEFKDIVAEQARQKQQEKAAKEDQRRRKDDEDRAKKKRKVRAEENNLEAYESASPESSGKRKRENRDRSRTPRSPSAHAIPLRPDQRSDSLSARYDSLTKATRSNSVFSRRLSNIIDLNDFPSDTEMSPSPEPYEHKSPVFPDRPSKANPVSMSHSDDDDDVEDVLNPKLQALRDAALARAQRSELASASQSPSAGGSSSGSPVVQLFVTSKIEGTDQLLIKVRLNTDIRKVRAGWGAKYKLSEEQTEAIFFTWNNMRLTPSTTILRLGVVVDDQGNASLKGDSRIYADGELPKIHIEAWTEDVFAAHEKEKLEEAEAKRKAAEAPPLVEEEPEPEPEPEVPKIRLILKARGKEDFKIQVKPDTTVGHLTAAYKKSRAVADDQPVTLMFDGDRLSPIDTITDAGIEDMDTIEVFFK